MVSCFNSAGLSKPHNVGVLAIEGNGTWVDWVIDNPERLKNMYMRAVEMLEQRWITAVPDPTDSDDSIETRYLRQLAHKNKVIAGLGNWHGYQSYCGDFEGSNIADSRTELLLRGIPVDLVYIGQYGVQQEIMFVIATFLNSKDNDALLATNCSVSIVTTAAKRQMNEFKLSVEFL